MEFSPGQWWQKLLTATFAACAVGIHLYTSSEMAFWVAAVLAVMMAILSVPVLYRKWEALAEQLSVWIVRALFSVVYFLVVPVVAAGRGIGARLSSAERRRSTAWIPKSEASKSFEDLERMG